MVYFSSTVLVNYWLFTQPLPQFGKPCASDPFLHHCEYKMTIKTHT